MLNGFFLFIDVGYGFCSLLCFFLFSTILAWVGIGCSFVFCFGGAWLCEC